MSFARQPTTVRLSEPERARLAALAAERGESQAAVVRRALRLLADAEERKREPRPRSTLVRRVLSREERP